MPGLAEVSWAEPALDYEAFAGRALPASPDHRLRGTRLPLGERAQSLRKAVRLVERHLVAGTVLCGIPLGWCRSFLPLGGRVCAGLSARPFFAARHEVMLQLMRMVTHCRDSWVWRLRPLARMRPPLGDCFLMDYYPRPLEGGPPSCRMPGGPRGCRPRASRLRLRSEAARRVRAVALRARSAWSMGHHCAPGAEAWARASAAAAVPDTSGTPTPRRACVVRGPRPGSHRAARCSCPRTGALAWRRCPLGSAGPAPPPKPSQPRAPRRRAGARPP